MCQMWPNKELTSRGKMMNELRRMEWRLWLGGNVWYRRRLDRKHTARLRDRVQHRRLVNELWRRVEGGRGLHVHERLVHLQLIAQKLLIVQQRQRTIAFLQVGLLVEHFFQLIEKFAPLLKHPTSQMKNVQIEINFKFDLPAVGRQVLFRVASIAFCFAQLFVCSFRLFS